MVTVEKRSSSSPLIGCIDTLKSKSGKGVEQQGQGVGLGRGWGRIRPHMLLSVILMCTQLLLAVQIKMEGDDADTTHIREPPPPTVALLRHSVTWADTHSTKIDLCIYLTV